VFSEALQPLQRHPGVWDAIVLSLHHFALVCTGGEVAGGSVTATPHPIQAEALEGTGEGLVITLGCRLSGWLYRLLQESIVNHKGRKKLYWDPND